MPTPTSFSRYMAISLLAFCICISFEILHTRLTHEPLCGTLTIVMPTKDGLVIMADRHAVGAHDGKDYDIEKLIDCGNYTAIVSTGMSMVANAPRKNQDASKIKGISFHASRLAKDHLTREDLRGSIKQFLPQIASALAESFVRHCSLSDSRSYAEKNNHFLFQTILYHYNRQGKRYECSYITFKLKDPERQVIDWQIQDAPDDYFSTSRAVPAGSNECLNRISKGETSHSEETSTIQEIRKFLRSTSKDQVDSSTALGILSEMFSATYRFEQTKETHSIGKLVDALEISPKGKRWRFQKHSVLRE